MNEYKKAIRILRRNLTATILFGLLLPFFAYTIGESTKSVAMISIVLIVFSGINLGYVRKVEEALHTETQK